MEEFAENLILNCGEVNRHNPTVKQESHPPPKKPLPMNQLASPVTEWGGAPDAYTRSKKLIPHKVPGTMGEYSSRRGAAGTTRTR